MGTRTQAPLTQPSPNRHQRAFSRNIVTEFKKFLSHSNLSISFVTSTTLLILYLITTIPKPHRSTFNNNTHMISSYINKQTLTYSPLLNVNIVGPKQGKKILCIFPNFSIKFLTFITSMAERGYRIVIYDTSKQADESLDDHIINLVDLIYKLEWDMDNYSIIGYDSCIPVVTELVTCYPEHINGVVLISPNSEYGFTTNRSSGIHQLFTNLFQSLGSALDVDSTSANSNPEVLKIIRAKHFNLKFHPIQQKFNVDFDTLQRQIKLIRKIFPNRYLHIDEDIDHANILNQICIFFLECGALSLDFNRRVNLPKRPTAIQSFGVAKL
ncbi:hypothetical protein BC833DRAFT_594180 [Globomyces pollinis-pini]|nr:hypothetical protein BC833DRAFT_594180 [Globomyces pollinis-pini]